MSTGPNHQREPLVVDFILPRPISNANWPCPMPLSHGVTAALLWHDMQAVAIGWAPNPQTALLQ